MEEHKYMNSQLFLALYRPATHADVVDQEDEFEECIWIW